MRNSAILLVFLSAAALSAGVAKADGNVIGEIGGFDTGRNIGNVVFPVGDVHPNPGDEFLVSTNTSPYVTFVVSNKGDNLGRIPSTFLSAAANATIVKDADGDGLDDIAIGGKIFKYDGTEIATLSDQPLKANMISTDDGKYALVDNDGLKMFEKSGDNFNLVFGPALFEGKAYGYRNIFFSHDNKTLFGLYNQFMDSFGVADGLNTNSKEFTDLGILINKPVSITLDFKNYFVLSDLSNANVGLFDPETFTYEKILDNDSETSYPPSHYVDSTGLDHFVRSVGGTIFDVPADGSAVKSFDTGFSRVNGVAAGDFNADGVVDYAFVEGDDVHVVDSESRMALEGSPINTNSPRSPARILGKLVVDGKDAVLALTEYDNVKVYGLTTPTNPQALPVLDFFATDDPNHDDASATEASMFLSWSQRADPNLASYELWMWDSNDSTKIADVDKGVDSLTVPVPFSQKLYRFKVASLNSFDETAWSDPAIGSSQPDWGNQYEVAGNVNGDERFNIFDLLDLLKVLGGSTTDPDYSRRADVDLNGTVNIFDLLEQLKMLGAGLEIPGGLQ